MQKHRRNIILLGITMSFILSLMNGCNLTGGVDSARSREEVVEHAKALVEQERCDEAVTELDQVPDPDDNVRKMLGWAYLCAAGATIDKVSKSLFSYDSSQNNLTIIGTLANELIPMDTLREARIDRAITAFSNMYNQNEAKLNQAIAKVIKAAAIIARQSPDSIHVGRADLVSSYNGCYPTSNCATVPAGCAAGRMDDTDANNVATALSESSTLITGLTQFGNVRNLIITLSAGTGVATVTRCFIVNSLLTD